MRALQFLHGDWLLDYTVTRHGETSRAIVGDGTMRWLFDGVCLTFDYRMRDRASGASLGAAHGVFTWNQQAGRYHYFWFESSGACQQAKGWLRDEDTLYLEWEDIGCTQIFHRTGPGTMYLEMACPSQDLLLRVDFTRSGA